MILTDDQKQIKEILRSFCRNTLAALSRDTGYDPFWRLAKVDAQLFHWKAAFQAGDFVLAQKDSATRSHEMHVFSWRVNRVITIEEDSPIEFLED